MIENSYTELFWKDNVDKQWKIEYDGGIITNVELFSQSIEISESLCSETELRFGRCEASSLKFKVANIVKPLINDWLTVSVVLDHQESKPMVIGRYKVVSDKPTADKRHREIVAYDSMYDIINADVTEWYNSILPEENSTMSLRQFRESFVRNFGLEEVVPAGGLINDSMTVERTVEPEQMSGLDVITAICEINGCFGHIGRDGKFHYIYLPQAIEGLYPANDLYPDHAPEWMVQAKTGHLYPQDPKSTALGIDRYIKCQYEDYTTKRIAKLQIRQKENDIGIIWPAEKSIDIDNCYIIENNFLVYGKSHDEFLAIAENVFNKITDIVYRPFNASCVGNPCLEVGDPVRIPTKYAIVESYILKRTLKGIQSLRDNYTADGAEKYAEKLNGVQKSLIQLKGKTNILTRTVEETKSEIKDVEKGLTTTITQTAGEIRGEIANEVSGLNNTIRLTAEGIEAKIENTKEGLETEIRVTAEGVKAEVSQIYETKTNAGTQYAEIRSSVSVERDRISAEIQRAEKVEESLSGTITTTSRELSSKIEATEKNINLSVTQNIQETKKYADNAATDAKNAANAATDDKLREYSTTSEMSAAIALSVDGIKSEVSATYQTKAGANESYKALNSAITQTSTEIRSEVSSIYQTKTAAGESYATLQSSIIQTDSKISQKVSKGDVSSEINQEAGKIHLSANRLSWNSTYTSMSEDGKFRTSEAYITGGKIEVHGKDANETRLAVRLQDAYAIEISASSIDGHMKYLSGTLRNWMKLAPTSSWFSSPLTIGAEESHITYALYVGGTRNTHISNVLELDAPPEITSDRRLKTDIKYIDEFECLENIMKFSPAKFKYKSSAEVRHGFVAQDICGLFGEWNPARKNGEYLGVSYDEIIPDLVGAVKYLAKEIKNEQFGNPGNKNRIDRNGK